MDRLTPVERERIMAEAMGTRISREDLAMSLAELVAQRGTCQRSKVGCVIALEGRIVTTGYVGSPPGLPHCLDVGCLVGPSGGCIRTVHAEAGAIAFAARKGIAIEGAILYTTLSPCEACAKLILGAGIQKVVYREEYRDRSGLELLNAAGVEVCQFGLVDK